MSKRSKRAAFYARNKEHRRFWRDVKLLGFRGHELKFVWFDECQMLDAADKRWVQSAGRAARPVQS